jgi:hypothetical protein
LSTVSDFGRVSRGSAAHDAIALIEEYSDAGQAGIDARVFKEVDAGTLTPDKALAFWYEKRAVARLLVRLQQQANIGTAAATRLNQEQV